MKKKIILRSIVIILVLIEGISLYLLYRPNKEELLENVKTKEIINNNNNVLAIKVQDSNFKWNDTGTSTEWPDSNHYYYGTTCVDETGQDLGNTKQIVEFDDQTNTATITTKTTVYCTIYFAYKKNALELMHKTSGTTLGGGVNGTTAVDGLIRYKGTYQEVTNNYICFGTSNIDECGKNATTENKQKYLYRIIGITSADNDTLGLKKGQLKLIKAYPISSKYRWNSTRTDIYWDESMMVTYLNGTFLDTITGATGGKNWQDLIGEVDTSTGVNNGPKWYIDKLSGSTRTSFKTSEEPKTKVSENHKIGLMYATDFYNSWNYPTGSYNLNGWLYLTFGMTGSDSLNTDPGEWTMTNSGSGAYFVRSTLLDGSEFTGSRYVRPVFYVSSNIKLSGTGTENSPFIITI